MQGGDVVVVFVNWNRCRKHVSQMDDTRDILSMGNQRGCRMPSGPSPCSSQYPSFQ